MKRVPMTLRGAEALRAELKRLKSQDRPNVIKAITEAVVRETARALQDHELIKVKAPGGDRGARDVLVTQLAQLTASALVHRIGNVAVLYRPHESLPRILIPDA